MDDTAVLEAVRDSEPATVERIAERLPERIPTEAVRERLAALAEAGRVERVCEGEREREPTGGSESECESGNGTASKSEAETWSIARDPRIDESIDRMTDRLGRERRR